MLWQQVWMRDVLYMLQMMSIRSVGMMSNAQNLFIQSVKVMKHNCKKMLIAYWNMEVL